MSSVAHTPPPSLPRFPHPLPPPTMNPSLPLPTHLPVSSSPHPSLAGVRDSLRPSSLTTGEEAEISVAKAIERRDSWRKANVPVRVGSTASAPSYPRVTSQDSAIRWTVKPGRIWDCNPNPTSTKLNFQEFPNLCDTGRLKQRKKKHFGPPFDTGDRYFKYSVRKKEFPFQDVSDEAMKIKFTPIWLRWQSHRQSSSDGELEGK